MTPARPAASAARLLAWLYARDEQRALLASLAALEDEIGASLRPATDHQVAHARLAWWREECGRCAALTPRHPLTRAIAACFAGHDPQPLGGLSGMVDVAVWDLACATFGTRAELSGYCERWAGALVVPLARFAAPEVAADASRTLGALLHESELLGSLAADARAGRLRLPLDELSAAGIDPGSFPSPPWPDALAGLLSERHRELRAQLAAAVRAVPRAAQPALRPLLVWAALAHLGSRRAERRLPGAQPSGDHHAPLDGWRAWRAARRVDSGSFAL